MAAAAQRDGRHIERQRVKTAKLPEHRPGIALPLTSAPSPASAFLSPAAEQDLVRLRQIKALEGADGVWKDRDHPKLQQEAAVGGEAAREMAPRRRRSKTPAFTSSRIFLYVGRYTMRKER